MIAARLETDTCSALGADGADALWVADEEVQRADIGLHDGVVGVPNHGRQFVPAEELPKALSSC
jgi:hypothetical protein